MVLVPKTGTMLTSMSRAIVLTNSVFLFVSGSSVVLRIYARKHQLSPLSADDYFVVAAWVRPFPKIRVIQYLISPQQVFSAALAITNIIGVPIGGFGTPFESLSPAKAISFLKVRSGTSYVDCVF